MYHQKKQCGRRTWRAALAAMLLLGAWHGVWPARAGAVSSAVGDWGHFLGMAPRICLHNPDGRAFRFTIHLMRWPIAGWDWNRGDFPLRVTAPDNRVLIEGQFSVEGNTRTFEIAAGPAGTYVVDISREGNERQMVNLWLSSSLERSVVWTGNPDPEAGAFVNRWLVTQPSVPRLWWFWVPAGTAEFTIRTQRDIGNTQREAPAITVFTPRGQRIAALFGHPHMAGRIWPGDRRWRGILERTLPVEPGNAGRFWAFEARLGDAHNYSKISVTLDGVPPYVARSPEEWFDPSTGLPAPVSPYDEAAFMQSVADDALPFQMWAPSPALGDPDGVQIRGGARLALWNPERRPLRFDVGDYLVRKPLPEAPLPSATVRILDAAGTLVHEETLDVPHHHHGARPPRPLPPVASPVAYLDISGAARWFFYTYPATPLVLLGAPTPDGYSRFEIEIGTARHWYFQVPRGTRSFQIRVASGHAEDVVHLDVRAPDRTQAVFYGHAGELTVRVPEGLDGRIWHLRPDIGGATRIETGGDAATCRYLAINLTLDIKGVPGLLAPTFEQWFDPAKPE